MKRFVGADWDSAKCVVVYERDGKQVRSQVKREPAAVSSFVDGLDGDVIVGIESGDPFWARLWENAGAVVHIFDASKVRQFGKSFVSSGATDDVRSAEALLAMVQSPRHVSRANVILTEAAASLSRMLHLANLASKEAGTALNRLRSTLTQSHPAFAQAVGRSLSAKWALRALELGPTATAWNETPESERDAALGGCHRARRESLAEALGTDWQAVRAGEEATVRAHIRLLVEALQNALVREKKAKRLLEEAAKAVPSARALMQLDGIGAFLATAIVLGMNLKTGRDGLSIALCASPVTKRSGVQGDRKPLVKMRRSSSTAMRKAGQLMGFQLVGHYRSARAQYQYYRQRGLESNESYRRVTRSYSRIISAIIRDEKPFDEEMYIQRLKSKGHPWANEL